MANLKDMNKELRQKTLGELEAELGSLKKELFTLRFQHSIKQLDNPMKIVETKKNIARVLTALRQREIQENAR
ncbi:MAG: 50S ribosomal protein L29 [Eubacteriales bacterium]|nr:50S ribosomal protein L29 [Eubacteriales bacterium]MDD4476101.1 50S ribosomal protein L29 [Eubacteriales bacterium]